MVENKQVEKINKLLRKQILQKFGVVAVAVLAVGTVAYAGSHHSNASHALTPGVTGFSISPATANAAVGSIITATVQEFSSDPINSVQASITYDATKLQYVSMSEGTAFPTVAATSTATNGTIRVGRATLASKSVSGQNTVVSLQFKVLGSAGTTSLAFDPAFSFIVRSSDNVNVLSASTGSTYTMMLPAPTVSGPLSPASGPAAGGTSVTITGTNFVSGATVKFGNTPASSVVFNSATSLTAVSPSITSAGSVTVSVTNPDGQTATNTGTAAVSFKYLAPQPSITMISPASGPAAGGTTVTINGLNFAAGAVVRIGSLTSASITPSNISPTFMSVVMPAHAAGAVEVLVTNPDGQIANSSVNHQLFTYVASTPTVSSVSPTTGSTSGGTVVTITGTNFVSGATVTFGTTAATGVSFVSSTSLKATAPSGITGAVAVTVINPDAQKGSLISAFKYVLAGDANNDGRVNAIDLSILISHDGQNYPPADFNGDGTVGAADMAILLGKWTW